MLQFDTQEDEFDDDEGPEPEFEDEDDCDPGSISAAVAHSPPGEGTAQ